MDEIASITSFGNSSLIYCPWSDSDESIGSVSTTSTASLVLRTRNAQLLCIEPALIKARESLLDAIHLKREFIIACLNNEDSDLSIGRSDLKQTEKCKQQCVSALTVEISLLRRILHVLTETQTAIKRQREEDSCQPQAIKNTRGMPGEFKEEIISKASLHAFDQTIAPFEEKTKEEYNNLKDLQREDLAPIPLPDSHKPNVPNTAPQPVLPARNSHTLSFVNVRPIKPEIPQWLTVYCRGAPENGHKLRWDLFRVNELDHFDALLVKLYRQDMENIMLKYERIRSSMSLEIERRKKKNDFVDNKQFSEKDSKDNQSQHVLSQNKVLVPVQKHGLESVQGQNTSLIGHENQHMTLSNLNSPPQTVGQNTTNEQFIQSYHNQESQRMFYDMQNQKYDYPMHLEVVSIEKPMLGQPHSTYNQPTGINGPSRFMFNMEQEQLELDRRMQSQQQQQIHQQYHAFVQQYHAAQQTKQLMSKMSPHYNTSFPFCQPLPTVRQQTHVQMSMRPRPPSSTHPHEQAMQPQSQNMQIIRQQTLVQFLQQSTMSQYGQTSPHQTIDNLFNIKQSIVSTQNNPSQSAIQSGLQSVGNTPFMNRSVQPNQSNVIKSEQSETTTVQRQQSNSWSLIQNIEAKV